MPASWSNPDPGKSSADIAAAFNLTAGHTLSPSLYARKPSAMQELMSTLGPMVMDYFKNKQSDERANGIMAMVNAKRGELLPTDTQPTAENTGLPLIENPKTPDYGGAAGLADRIRAHQIKDALDPTKGQVFYQGEWMEPEQARLMQNEYKIMHPKGSAGGELDSREQRRLDLIQKHEQDVSLQGLSGATATEKNKLAPIISGLDGYVEGVTDFPQIGENEAIHDASYGPYKDRILSAYDRYQASIGGSPHKRKGDVPAPITPPPAGSAPMTPVNNPDYDAVTPKGKLPDRPTTEYPAGTKRRKGAGWEVLTDQGWKPAVA